MMIRFTVGLLLTLSLVAQVVAATEHTLVINNGRVIDPESGLDAIRHVGISGAEIVTISEQPLSGEASPDWN